MPSNEPIDAPPTARQRQIHEFMCTYQDEHGAPPTLREIAEHIGATSTNTATDHIRSLARRGMVRRAPGRARARGWVPVRTPQ